MRGGVMKKDTNFNRREFLGLTSSALAFSVVPRHVLGGTEHVAPSDKITLGLIGCGTQQLSELTELITDPRIQIVSVCDPVTYPRGYRDWSYNSLRGRIREVLDEADWGRYLQIPGGREVGKEVVEKYYEMNRGTNRFNGCTAYEDFREMLEEEQDMAAVKIITPDHQHGPQSIASMKKGKHTIMHKPLANKVYEARVAVETARQTGVMTHLLAWSDRSSFRLVKQWMDEGAIGSLNEIHIWSHRPVWEQWSTRPVETPPIPEGFNWPLWLGPVPDLPYHPAYTHGTYRGWYDFGAGAVADMGLYNLWPLFTTLGITSLPTSIEAYGTATRKTDENGVFYPAADDAAFPHSNIYRWKFPGTGLSPRLDLFWYDGGMKPHNPPEMETDNKVLDSEGILFVGDKGKIVSDFWCNTPKIIPEKAMMEHTGYAEPPEGEVISTDIWIDALVNGKSSPGSFQNAATCNETTLLGAVATRAGSRIDYEPVNMEITNMPEAEKFLYREEYRKGWEII